MDLVKMLVLFVHISAAIVWVGGLVFLRLLLIPALGRAAPAVVAPLMLDLGPRVMRVLLRAAEITIAAGIINVFLMGRISRMVEFYTTTWGIVILVGMVVSLIMYGMAQALTRPTTRRIIETIRAVAAGQGPADAQAQLERLGERQRNMLTVQVALAFLVALMMAIARFA